MFAGSAILDAAPIFANIEQTKNFKNLPAKSLA